MSEEILIHKETFFQCHAEGIPSAWIVQYWINDPNDFPQAAYFVNESEAIKFEKTLTSYDDWYTSQEILLNCQ